MSKKRPPSRIKAVLFDLGKVILFFNFEPAFKKLARSSGISPKEIEDYFVSSGLEVLYDGGKITSRQFFLEVKQSLSLKIGFREFRAIWNGIFTPNRPMIRLIRSLAAKHRLVLVSNTNEMHFQFIRNRYKILKKFSGIVVSYQEKVRKPDEQIYRIAAKACQARPHEIFYIDDRADLTEAARDLGFHVFTYKNNFLDLKKSLSDKGVL